MKKTILFISIILVAIGSCGGPLITRFYFLNGGKVTWLATCLQTAGWPISFLLLLVSYLYRRKTEEVNAKLISMGFRIIMAAALIGLIFGIANFLYASAVKCLPSSTSILISSTQLAFVAIFAFIIVKQKFTYFSIAAVVFLIAGAASLAVGHSSDRSSTDHDKLYAVSFGMMVAYSALNGLLFPSVELLYNKADQADFLYFCYGDANGYSTFRNCWGHKGMLIKKGFQVIPHDAGNFELGKAMYCLVVVSAAVLFQYASLGTLGVVYSSSSFLFGIINTICLPITEILAVILFQEKFGLGKGLFLALCILGFAFYYYGEIKQNHQLNATNEEDSQRLLHV